MRGGVLGGVLHGFDKCFHGMLLGLGWLGGLCGRIGFRIGGCCCFDYHRSALGTCRVPVWLLCH